MAQNVSLPRVCTCTNDICGRPRVVPKDNGQPRERNPMHQANKLLYALQYIAIRREASTPAPVHTGSRGALGVPPAWSLTHLQS